MTEEERILKKFRKTPLRWYPSGKKVYTVKFRLTLLLKKIGDYTRFYIWRIKNGYL